MGTLTLTQLQDEVRAYHGNRTDLDARLTRFLNFAQIRLARAFSFPELHKFVTATGSFVNDSTDRFLTLPANTHSIKDLVLEDEETSRKLEYKSPREFDRMFTGYIARGRRKPIIYTKWRETIELMPLPDEAYDYEIRYVIWPADLVNGTDTSELDRKDELLILLAASIMHHSLGNTDKGRNLFGMFRTLLKDTIEDEHLEPDQDIKADSNDRVLTDKYWANPFIKGRHGAP